MVKGKDVRHTGVEEIRARGVDAALKLPRSERAPYPRENPSIFWPTQLQVPYTRSELAEYSTLAAVDLGSNSFHLQVGRVVDDQIYPLDSLREPVRLGGGLTADKRARRATQARALDVPGARSASGCAASTAAAVRAVGTNTLRVAKNAPPFLRRRAGRARASRSRSSRAARRRASSTSASRTRCRRRSDKRLVVDIGGGSTEFIIGSRLRAAQARESSTWAASATACTSSPTARSSKSAMKAGRARRAQGARSASCADFRARQLAAGGRLVGHRPRRSPTILQRERLRRRRHHPATGSTGCGSC